MMSKRKNASSFFTLWTTWLLLGLSALAQAPFPVSGGQAGDLLSDPAFAYAFAFKESFRYEESLAEVRKVAAAHAGTELEAAAKTEIASMLSLMSYRAAEEGNSALAADLRSQSDAEWQSIINRYPYTKYWFEARAELIHSGPPEYYALLEEVSGVSYDDVRTGKLLRVEGDKIPIQYRQYVMDLFRHGGSTATREEQANFRLFFLRSFPKSGSISDLQYYYLTEGYDTLNDDLDTTPAVLEVAAPQDGAVVSRDGAILMASAHDGDIRSRQVEMSNSIVELDGEDILSACELDYQIDATGPIFATVTIRYVPPAPLSVGSHTYRVAIRESAEGQVTEKVINFTVSENPPPPPPGPSIHVFNSVTQWNGGATYASQGTAPALIVNNHQTGELRFRNPGETPSGCAIRTRFMGVTASGMVSHSTTKPAFSNRYVRSMSAANSTPRLARRARGAS